MCFKVLPSNPQNQFSASTNSPNSQLSLISKPTFFLNSNPSSKETNSSSSTSSKEFPLQLLPFTPIPIIIQSEALPQLSKITTCSCSKTKCLKKYCECLANNQYCFNCNCVNCHNNPSYQQEKLKEVGEELTCTCTKSNCNKKYCECYKAGRGCNENCRCLNCMNKEKINGEIYEEEDDKKKGTCNKMKRKGKKEEGLTMMRISVYVNEQGINIEQKDIFKNDDEIDKKMIGVKRVRNEDKEEEKESNETK